MEDLMHTIQRSIAVLFAVLGTFAIAVPAASAGGGDTALCALAGVTGLLDPPILAVPAPGTTPDMSNDGSYKFDSTLSGGTATCVVTDAQNDADTPPPGVDATAGTVQNVVIRSDGIYTNLLLGTGSVAGTAGVSAPAGSAGEFGSGAVPLPTTATPAVTGAAGTQQCPPTRPVPDTLEPHNYTWTVAPAVNYTTIGYGIDFTNSSGKLGGGAVTPPLVGNPADVLPDAMAVTTQGNVHIVASPPVAWGVACPPVSGGQPGAMYVQSFTVVGSFVFS
jgi:hypothetical protein